MSVTPVKPNPKRCPKGTRKNKQGDCVPPKEKTSAEKRPKQKTHTQKNMDKKHARPPTSKATVKHMETFKDQGVSVLEALSKTELNQIIHVANKQYHAYTSNQTPPTLSDPEFDVIKEYVERKHPDVPALHEVGAAVASKHKVTLPVHMPSMDKIKPTTDALSTWKQTYTGPYVLSCKLDGVSGLYYTLNGQRKLYTRGNGSVGQDVSHLLKYITLPVVENIIVRGEFIVTKATFNTHYKDTMANIRNMVAGVINQKKIDAPKARHIDFVAYEVIAPVLPPSQQMAFLQQHGFHVVQHETHRTLSNDMLSKTLVEWRNGYAYEIDGVIVADDRVYERTDKNPKHAFAFKMVISDQMAETQVTDVVWTASKAGYLKPRVRVNPVHIGGVKIEYATGFNGKFIEDNQIGIGAVVQLIRSGDVIPYIKGVTVPAPVAKMPDVPYTWTESHIDVLVANKADDPVVLEKQITAFFTGLEVDGLSSGNVKRLVQAGYNTIPKITHMRHADYLRVDGFKEKLATKIHDSMHQQLEKATVPKLLAAANAMGRGMGERKLKPVFQKYPNVLTSGETDAEKTMRLQSVDGIGKENAKMFVEHIPEALEFLAQIDAMDKLTHATSSVNIPVHTTTTTTTTTPTTTTTKSAVQTTHPLYQKKVVFTGFRDKALMETLEQTYEVTLASSINKHTFVVVTKEADTQNKKLDKARELDIPVMTITQFREQYHV